VHDEIGGLLTAIKMDLAWMKERLPKTKKMLTDKTTTIENMVDKAMTAARNLAHSLRPGYFGQLWNCRRHRNGSGRI